MNGSSEKYLTVTQDNRICQTAYAEEKENDLATYQKQLIFMAIARVQKEDTEFKIEKFSFREFMDIMNISAGGNTERMIADSVENLVEKSFIIKNADGQEEELFWVDPEITRVDWKKKVIFIQLNKDLEKYFLNLDKLFTSFQLGFVTNFKSKYSFRIYEYLHSYLGLGKLIVKREDALKILGNSCYHHIADFDRFVMKRAIEEINEHSDITVEYYRRIERKTITHYFFKIRRKDSEDIEAIQEEWIPAEYESEYDKITKDFNKFLNPCSENKENKKEKNVYESETL
jgi:plasmid replication initiation protein